MVVTAGTTQSASALERRARVAARRACSKRVIRYPLSESSSRASVASNRSDEAVRRGAVRTGRVTPSRARCGAPSR